MGTCVCVCVSLKGGSILVLVKSREPWDGLSSVRWDAVKLSPGFMRLSLSGALTRAASRSPDEFPRTHLAGFLWPSPENSRQTFCECVVFAQTNACD